MSDPRSVGRARQPDPPLSELGVARGCLRAPHSRHQRAHSARGLPRRRRFLMVARETYLDWNATAPLRPEAAEAMASVLAACGNPSSVHRWGRAARRRIEDAREAVAALVAAPADGVVFTSGGTEANHLALRGAGRERVLVSTVEHSSVLQAVP